MQSIPTLFTCMFFGPSNLKDKTLSHKVTVALCSSDFHGNGDRVGGKVGKKISLISKENITEILRHPSFCLQRYLAKRHCCDCRIWETCVCVCLAVISVQCFLSAIGLEGVLVSPFVRSKNHFPFEIQGKRVPHWVSQGCWDRKVFPSRTFFRVSGYP